MSPGMMSFWAFCVGLGALFIAQHVTRRAVCQAYKSHTQGPSLLQRTSLANRVYQDEASSEFDASELTTNAGDSLPVLPKIATRGVSMSQNRNTLETAAQDFKLQDGLNRSGAGCKMNCFKDGKQTWEEKCESKFCSGCDVCDLLTDFQMSMHGACYLLFINIDEDQNLELDETELTNFFSLEHCMDCITTWTGKTYTVEECTDLICGDHCPVDFEQFLDGMGFLEHVIPNLLQEFQKRPLFWTHMQNRSLASPSWKAKVTPPAIHANSQTESKAADTPPPHLLQQVEEHGGHSPSSGLIERHLLNTRKERKVGEMELDEMLVGKPTC